MAAPGAPVLGIEAPVGEIDGSVELSRGPAPGALVGDVRSPTAVNGVLVLATAEGVGSARPLIGIPDGVR